jgi:hypothetical protein
MEGGKAEGKVIREVLKEGGVLDGRNVDRKELAEVVREEMEKRGLGRKK